jgi:hypothetical protein
VSDQRQRKTVAKSGTFKVAFTRRGYIVALPDIAAISEIGRPPTQCSKAGSFSAKSSDMDE